MPSGLSPDADHPVLRLPAEIELFFLRAEPFVESRPRIATISIGPSLERLGS